MAETIRTWVREKARSFGVGESAVACALGLHNTERRQPHWWNKHQSRFYAMNRRGPEGGSLLSFKQIELH
jgi:hypothetical protein